MGANTKRSRPRIVAVAGGKGGVGKSTVAVNLGTAIARTGKRVVLVDGDLGAANLHTMMGIIHPSVGIAQLLDEQIDTLEPARMAISPALSLVPGTSRPGSANLTGAARLRLVRALLCLDADTVIVDVGAGTGTTVLDLVGVSDIKLFVITPQLPSLHNAYALLKACVHRITRKLAKDDVEQGLIDAALGNDHKARTMVQLIEVLRGFDPKLAERIGEVLARFGGALVCNQLTSAGEAAALSRIPSMINDHLMLATPVVGQIKRTNALAGSLKAGTNVVDPAPETMQLFQALASHVMTADIDRLRRAQRPERATMPHWTRRIGDTLAGEPVPATTVQIPVAAAGRG